CGTEVLTNNWLVELDGEGGIDAAKAVAKRTGFNFVSPMLGSQREFHFTHSAVPHIRSRRSIIHTRKLKAHPMVKRAIQQTGFRRAKRGFQPKIRGVPVSEIRLKDPESAKLLDYSKSYSYAEPQDPLFQKEWYLMLGSQREFHFTHTAVPHVRSRRSIIHTRKLKAHPMVKRAIQQTGFRRAKRGFQPKIRGVPVSEIRLKDPESAILLDYSKSYSYAEPQDPLFQKEWYLKNVGQSGGKPGLDLNVEIAWAMGYTGKDVTTAIMDDGIDYLHEDLKNNY
ncbi:Hypothetical predicted protein, partial [Mytilus galloprovincialis]